MWRSLWRALARGLAFLVLLFCVGCAHTPGGIAPSTMPLGNRDYRRLGRVQGTDSYVKLFGLLPIKGSNSTYSAMRAALRSRNADALIEVTVDSYAQWWIILTRHVIMVEGEAVEFLR